MPFYVAALIWLHSTTPGRAFSAAHIAQAAALGFLGYYLSSYLDLCGLTFISAQLERLTLFTYPALVACLAWIFLGEGFNRNVLVAIVLSYAGIALMVSKEKLLAQHDHLSWGVLLVFGSAISFAFYILLAQPAMQRMGSRQFTSFAMIGSTVLVCIHFVCTRPLSELFGLTPIVYGYAAFLAFACTVIPSFMINEAILRIGATRTSVIGTVGPVLTMLLAVTILREPTSWQHVVGMVVAVYGVSLVMKK